MRETWIFGIFPVAGILVALGLLAIPSGMAGSASLDSAPKCRTSFEGFRQSVSWYKTGTKVLIEATQACDSKFGLEMDLSEVQLTVQAGDRICARLRSKEGSYFPKKGLVLVGDSSLDLKTGELRSPGRRLFVNRNPDCRGTELGNG